MRNLLNSDQSYTGLVQKYIGSAYDVVLAVYMALEEIKAVYGAIDSPEWDELVKLAPHFEEFMKMLQEFHSSFYGALSAPLTNAAGEYVRPQYDKNAPHQLSQDGDLYYDKARMGLYMFEAGHWERVGATSNQLEVVKVEAKHIQGSRCRIPLKHGYQPGTNSIMVFVNATFQYPMTPANPDGAYHEVDEHTIEFPLIPTAQQGNIEEGDVVTVLIGGVVTNVEHEFSVDVETHEVQGVPQETVFTIGMGYLPGAHNLEVYVDGLRQNLGLDYVETDDSTVTFMHPIMHGSVVVFKKGHVIGNSAGAGNLGDVDILNVMGEFYSRNRVLQQNSVIMLLGYHAVADGGAGFFVYNPLVPRTYANGGTVVDASVPLDMQGQGSGSGCWVRQYDRELNFGWFGVDEPLVKGLTHIPLARDGDTIYVEGYHKAGDGGEGWFRWDENRRKLDHDGGIVIDPHHRYPKLWNAKPAMDQWFDPQAQLPTGGTTGCWIRMNLAEATINWFGAVGDGTTDNTAVFEGIATALQHDEISRLGIPKGDYLLSNPWPMVVRNASGKEIYGMGRSSALILDTGVDKSPIQFIDCTNIRLRNFRIEDNSTVPNKGVVFLNGGNITLENIWFSDFADSAIYIANNVAAGTGGAIDRVLIDNCVFLRGDYTDRAAVVHAPSQDSNEFHLRNCSFREAGDGSHPLVIAGVAVHDAVISNNFFERCKSTGIHVTAYHEVQVSENHFTDHEGYAIEVNVTATAGPGYGAAGYGAATLAHCLVRDNVIEQVTEYGIRIAGGSSNNGPVTVSNNHIVNGPGILCAPSATMPNIMLLNNDIADPDVARPAIYFDDQFGGSSTEPMVRGNRITHGGPTEIQFDAVRYVQVIGNIFAESNMADDPGHQCILINDASADHHMIRDNVVTARAGHPKTLVSVSSPTPVVSIINNTVADLETAISNSNLNLGSPEQGAFGQSGLNKFMVSSSPPTGGGTQGDIVFNAGASAAGDPAGWIYTGSAWNAFGVLT
jgi:hypothetical protein